MKFLSAGFIRDGERLGRFEQEARATSALNHPNIIHIYEVGQADSTHFIAAEYLDGATLRTHMATTRMNSSGILDIAVQVASALAAAHARGVVHRDIKPENIMVLRENYSLHRENYVTVLDFGIAKLTEAAAKPLINTNQGVVLGTASYMSPEQARGQVVLHEKCWRPSPGGKPVKLLPFPSSMKLRIGLEWTPDSSTLLFVNRNGVSNIWGQPINGEPPKQLTNFKSDLIFNFALSADGRNLVLARGTQTRDIVLIRDFR